MSQNGRSRHLRPIIWQLLLYTVLVAAQNSPFHWSVSDGEFFTCSNMLSEYSFPCSSDLSYWECICQNKERLGSLLICGKEIMSTKSYKHAQALTIFYCEEYGDTLLNEKSIDSVYQNATKYILDLNDPLINYDPSKPLYNPISMPRDEVLEQQRKMYPLYHNFEESRFYGGVILIYFLFAMTIGGLVNSLKKYYPKYIKYIHGPYSNYFRSKVTIPPAWNHHSTPFYFNKYISGLVPTNSQIYILAGYLTLLLVLVFSGYNVFTVESGNLYVHYSLQTIRMLADRTGIIAFIHLPPIFLFAGRNNLFLQITGWPYETFIVYHKWLARGMVALALIHAICWTIYEIVTQRYSEAWSRQYWQFGVLAIFAGCVLLFQAIHYFRSNNYEGFLLLHIFFCILFTIGAYMHCIEIGFMEWVYFSIFFWVLDRTLRWVRILLYGSLNKAEYQYYTDNTIKITIKKPKSWNPYPGAFVYIYVLSHSVNFWESHPFCLVYNQEKSEDNIELYIKVKEGLSKKLADYLQTQPKFHSRIHTLVEGFYGEESPIENYDTAMMIVGGSGMPNGFYSAIHLANQGQTHQRIVFIWAIRDLDCLKWFHKDLAQLKHSKVDITIYVTRGKIQVEGSQAPNENNILLDMAQTSTSAVKLSFEEDQTSESQPLLNNKAITNYVDNVISITELLSFIKFKQGRPDIDSLMKEEFSRSSGSVGIISCGPSKMNDDVRRSVADNLKICDGRVDLFEEAQV